MIRTYLEVQRINKPMHLSKVQCISCFFDVLERGSDFWIYQFFFVNHICFALQILSVTRKKQMKDTFCALRRVSHLEILNFMGLRLCLWPAKNCLWKSIRGNLFCKFVKIVCFSLFWPLKLLYIMIRENCFDFSQFMLLKISSDQLIVILSNFPMAKKIGRPRHAGGTLYHTDVDRYTRDLRCRVLIGQYMRCTSVFV